MDKDVTKHSNILSLKQIVIGYAVAFGALAAVNLRWRHISTLWRKKARCLPVTRCLANNNGPAQNEEIPAPKRGEPCRPTVILLHGMWHDASWWRELQAILRERGYTSYAIELLPGQRFFVGFTQSEILNDLEKTLKEEIDKISSDEGGREFILVGHSQGGIVVQSCLKNNPWIRSKTRAVVLMGTYPLGHIVPFSKVRSHPKNMYSHRGIWGVFFFGKIFSVDYLKYIFLLPTTDETKLKSYTDKILKAPSDGFITVTHHLFRENIGVISTKPTLVLGAAKDIIYPPHLLADDFQARFPNSTHVIIPNQAHCFMDPTENSKPTMPDTLLEWLDGLDSKQ